MNKAIRYLIIFSLIFFQSHSLWAQQPSLNWIRHIGAPGESFAGVSVAIDSNKSVILAGLFKGTTDFDDGPGVFNMTSNGDQDLFVAEYDSSGRFRWAKHLGGAQGDIVRSMKMDKLGNILILGMYQGTVDMDPGPGVVNVTSVGSDAFLLKLDNNGNYLWSRQWQVYSMNTLETDISNNILIGGDFGGPADFDPGNGVYTLTGGNIYSDLFICKLDPNGNFKWAKQMPNQSTAQMQELTMESDSRGNVFMGGNFTASLDFDPGTGTTILNSNGADDGFVVKLDSNGVFSWAKKFGGAGTDKVWSLELDNTDAMVMTGQYNGTVDFDPGVGAINLTTTTNRGCFIVKLDNNGNLVFAKSFDGEAFGECITFDATNQIYISGGFYNTVDFDPDAAVHSLTDGNIFIAKLNTSGSYVWAVQFQTAIIGSYESIYNAIKTDVQKNIYYTGIFPFNVDYDPGPGTQIVTPYGNTDIPLVKLNGGGCRTPDNNINIAACESYTLNGIAYTTSGNYSQSMTNATGCDSLINLSLTIYPKPTPSLGNDSLICPNKTILLTPGSFSSYQWSDGASGSQLQINQPGSYWVTVTDINNCQGRDTIQIFPATTGCINDVCELNTETKFYPNPFGSKLLVNKNATTCSVKMNLYNALGQLIIKDYLLVDGLNDIDFTKYGAGVYFYRLHSNNQILKTGKLLKMGD